MAADKIILVHNGAMGDFLIAWPAALAVARKYGQNAALFFAGRELYSGWAAAAGFDPASAEVRAAVERLYAAADWNDPALAPLAGSLVVWIGLEKPPFAASLLQRPNESTRLVFLPMLSKGNASARSLLARMAREQLGIVWPEDAGEVWRERVGSWRGGAGEALLFPGAGHRAKEWPAGHWRKLATLLPSHGIACRFALGPAELERGFDGQGVPTVTPESLDELASLVADASVVVCADTGPMHLAALSGTPALALFGPTSAGQWAPVGVCVLRAGVDCRPCSRTTRNIPCAAPECMATITVDEAARHVRTLLEGDKKKKPA